MLKNSYISQKKAFLTFLEMEPCTFQLRLEKKKKKKPPKENLLYLRKQKPQKNLLYFLKRKLFLYFRKQK